MSNPNIWDFAVDLARNNDKSNGSSCDSVMLIIGCRNSGKTTVTYKFLEKNDIPKPTLALEYSFVRKSRNTDLDKDVCHIWELGGATIFKDLLQIPIAAKNLSSLYVVLVLDLSAPDEIWFTMQTLLSSVRKQIEEEIQNSTDLTLKTTLEEQIKQRHQHKTETEKAFDPFPVPLLIVGSKYDLFQEIESEKRKLLCKCLRYFACIHGATLQFVTNHNDNLMNKLRTTLRHLLFGTAPNKSHSLDYRKPLYIPFGIDSFQAIGSLPDPDNASIGIKVQSLEDVTKCFLAFYPQVEDQNILLDDPCKDPNFREQEIDLLRAEKDKELEEFKKQMQKTWR